MTLTNTVLILSDEFSAEELKTHLQAGLPADTPARLEAAGGAERARDAAVLSAIIAGGASVLGTLATFIIEIYQSKRNTDQVAVTIKRTDGVEVSFPAGSSPQEIQSYFRMAESEGIQIEHLGFEEEN